jgi:hypothetical protein
LDDSYLMRYSRASQAFDVHLESIAGAKDIVLARDKRAAWIDDKFFGGKRMAGKGAMAARNIIREIEEIDQRDEMSRMGILLPVDSHLDRLGPSHTSVVLRGDDEEVKQREVCL